MSMTSEWLKRCGVSDEDAEKAGLLDSQIVDRYKKNAAFLRSIGQGDTVECKMLERATR